MPEPQPSFVLLAADDPDAPEGMPPGYPTRIVPCGGSVRPPAPPAPDKWKRLMPAEVTALIAEQADAFNDYVARRAPVPLATASVEQRVAALEARVAELEAEK